MVTGKVIIIAIKLLQIIMSAIVKLFTEHVQDIL